MKYAVYSKLWSVLIKVCAALVWSKQRCLCEVTQLGKIGMETKTDNEIEAAALRVGLAWLRFSRQNYLQCVRILDDQVYI